MKKPSNSADPAEDPVAAEEESDEGEADRRDGAQHEEVSGANIDVALREHFLQLGNAAGAAEKVVESRNLAEDFVTQKWPRAGAGRPVSATFARRSRSMRACAVRSSNSEMTANAAR